MRPELSTPTTSHSLLGPVRLNFDDATYDTVNSDTT